MSRLGTGIVGVAIYGASHAGVQVARGIVADSSSNLADTATQGGIVVVCIGLVYWFLQRSDKTAQTTKDSRVAELEAAIAELRGRLAGAEERFKVADTESRAIRVDWLQMKDQLTQVQAEHIVTLKELHTVRDQLSSVLATMPRTRKTDPD